MKSSLPNVLASKPVLSTSCLNLRPATPWYYLKGDAYLQKHYIFIMEPPVFVFLRSFWFQNCFCFFKIGPLLLIHVKTRQSNQCQTLGVKLEISVFYLLIQLLQRQIQVKMTKKIFNQSVNQWISESVSTEKVLRKYWTENVLRKY